MFISLYDDIVIYSPTLPSPPGGGRPPLRPLQVKFFTSDNGITMGYGILVPAVGLRRSCAWGLREDKEGLG